MVLSLQEIITGCRENNAVFQKHLYRQYFSLFMNICMRYADNREDAEEMLQNGFLKIFSNINQYEGAGSFEGWMKRILVNVALDHYRYKKNTFHRNVIHLQHAEKTDERMMDDAMYSSGMYNESLYEGRYSKEDLETMLHQLPPTTKQIFNLYVFEEYTHKEIGALMNIAERTSQFHLAQARKILTEELEKKTQLIKLKRV
jgi:RNA polymerase sigma factor (sigma-70 family)